MSSKAFKVVQLASGDSWGGAESQLYFLCRELTRYPDIELNVILLNEGELFDKLSAEGINVTVFDESKLNAVQIFFKIKAFLKSVCPHILHTHREKENVLGGIAAKLNGIKSIRSVHGAPEHLASWLKPHKRVIPTLNRMVGKWIQEKIVSVSYELTELLLEEYEKSKLVTVENGIDPSLLDSFKQTPDLKLNNSVIKLGIVGRLVPVKRVDRFIEAAKLVTENLHNRKFEFHVYGDGPLMSELSEQANALSLTDSLKFHGHSQTILQQIAELDILLMTSDHEGLPMTLLEAMYLGTPVICSSVGAIPHVLQDGKYGGLVNQLTAQGFSEKIISQLENSEQTLKAAEEAQKSIIRNYTAAQNAKKFAEIYSQISTLEASNLIDKIGEQK